jgi:transposase-like protein
MARGRRPGWAEVVERLEGSAAAKARLRAVLEALTGGRTLAAVCLHLGISERHYRALRDRALQAALAALEPRPAGRPARSEGEAGGRVAELEATVRELRLDLRAAQVREEIALLLPQVLRRRGRARRARRRKGRRPGAGARSGASSGCGPWGRRRRVPAERGGGARPGSGRPGRRSARSGCGPWPSPAGRPAWA